MAISIKVAGASFAHVIDRSLPLVSEASGLWYLSSLDEAKTNVLTGAQSTVIGAPQFNAGIATLSNTDGFDTGITVASGSQFFFVAVCSTAHSGTGGGYVGTWHSSINSAKLYSINGVMHCASGGGAGPNVALPLSNAFTFKAGGWNGTTTHVYAHDGSAMLTASVPSAASATNTFRIGAMGGGSPFNIAAAMLFHRALSAAEVGDLYGYLKAKLGLRGASVL